MFGAFITKSPQNWQILGQNDSGFAITSLEGTFTNVECDLAVKGQVYVRVVNEDNNENVIDWTVTNCEKDFSGNWNINLNIPVGGLYRIETCFSENGEGLEWAKRGDMRHHIGVGDVYVIAGQSNSAGYGRDSIYDPPCLGVHLYRNSNTWDLATHPMNENTNTAHMANYEGANSGVSPYLAFAKNLKAKLNYPIGLIQTSLGGTPLEWWNPNEDGRLYRNMVEIIKSTNSNIKGILWYQGCSDTNDIDTASSYSERFKVFAESVRKEFGDSLPILTCGLNRCIGESDDVKNKCWGIVRDEQRKCMEMNNVFMVTTLDCALSDGIHNSAGANVLIGERLAKSALFNVYNIGNNFNPATIREALINDNVITIKFSNVFDRLVTHSKFPVDVFCGDEKISSRTELLNKDTLKVTIDEYRNGLTVAMCWEENPMPFPVFEYKTAMPVAPFFLYKVK